MNEFFAFVLVCAVELLLAAKPTLVIRKELEATVYVVEYGVVHVVN